MIKLTLWKHGRHRTTSKALTGGGATVDVGAQASHGAERWETFSVSVRDPQAEMTVCYRMDLSRYEAEYIRDRLDVLLAAHPRTA